MKHSALLLLSFIGLSSCKRDAGSGTMLPPLETGRYYDIVFPKDSESLRQTSFKVLQVRGSWAQVECFGNPGDGMALLMIQSLPEMAKDKPKEEIDKMKADGLAKLREKIHPKWINLSLARTISETSEENLKLLKDL
jgi:hypothetical protein